MNQGRDADEEANKDNERRRSQRRTGGPPAGSKEEEGARNRDREHDEERERSHKAPRNPPVPPTGPGCPPTDTPIPQPPPPRFQSSAVPPWREGRPPTGDPREMPWFQDKLAEIRRNGPRFGPRKDELLPFIVVRAASGDRGQRPYSGAFWESPDILVAPNQDPNTAPLMPAAFGGIANANVPTTLYAHVWNLGKAAAYRVRVEFYWANPSLGISRANANFIGAAWVDLTNRFTLYRDWVEVNTVYGRWLSRGAHAIVRCPTTWIPRFENNGHECVIVRAFEPMLDPLAPDQFSPAVDRRVGQRNIAVVQAASPAVADLLLSLGQPDFPADGQVDVIVDGPETMEWLKLFAGDRNPGYRSPAANVAAGLFPPTLSGGAPTDICGHLQIGFHASIADLQSREAQVIRLRKRIRGNVLGGYSVVLLKT